MIQVITNRLTDKQKQFLVFRNLSENPLCLIPPARGFSMGETIEEFAAGKAMKLVIPIGTNLRGIFKVKEVRGKYFRVNWASGKQFPHDVWVSREEFDQRDTMVFFILLFTVGTVWALMNRWKGAD